MIGAAIAASFILLICLWLKWQYSYWKRNKVEGPAPYPIFGNMIDYVMVRRHFGFVYDDLYSAYTKAKYVGFYKLSHPAILIRDLDLVKDILIQNVTHFFNNDFIIDPKLDPLLATSPFFTNDDKWKTARVQVAPMLTVAKLRQAFPLTKNVAHNLVEYIGAGSESNDMVFDAKDLSARFIIDNIATIVFGVEGESFTKVDAKFLKMSQSIFDPSAVAMVRSLISLFAPAFGSLLKIGFVSTTVDTWVRKMVKEVLHYRSENNVERNDLLQALINLRDKGEITDEVLMGHSLLFLTEGYETSSTTLAFSLFEIASNPKIQKQVQMEIDKAVNDNDGELSDEALSQCAYMEMIIYETLRLHNPVFSLAKICTKEFSLPPQFTDDNTEFKVPVGMTVIVPIYSIHTDPNYFPKPFVFDPERFNEDNKRSRPKYSFLGFGEGPRICPGIRLALTQMRAALAAIIYNYDITVAAKTVLPLQVDPKSFVLHCKDGMWLNFTKRVK